LIAYNLFNRSTSADCISVNAGLAAPPIDIAIKRTEQAEPQEDLMKELLAVIAENTIMIIHAMALVIISIGTIQAFLLSLRTIFNPSPIGNHFHYIYLQYARYLVGGLTFQLAADIIESSLATKWEWEWDEIGRLAAIAVIRTFLNFFLERDVSEMERREAKPQGALDEPKET
jgi:uncharacterized membrane protein